MSEEMSE